MELHFKNIRESVELDLDDIGTVTIECTDWSQQDDGIGAYEYHGACGYDSDPYHEVEAIEVTEVKTDEKLGLEEKSLLIEKANNEVDRLWKEGKISFVVDEID